jgi:hypothetical protein
MAVAKTGLGVFAFVALVALASAAHGAGSDTTRGSEFLTETTAVADECAAREADLVAAKAKTKETLGRLLSGDPAAVSIAFERSTSLKALGLEAGIGLTEATVAFDPYVSQTTLYSTFRFDEKTAFKEQLKTWRSGLVMTVNAPHAEQMAEGLVDGQIRNETLSAVEGAELPLVRVTVVGAPKSIVEAVASGRVEVFDAIPAGEGQQAWLPDDAATLRALRPMCGDVGTRPPVISAGAADTTDSIPLGPSTTSSDPAESVPSAGPTEEPTSSTSLIDGGSTAELLPEEVTK